jgi:hypothetical protein
MERKDLATAYIYSFILFILLNIANKVSMAAVNGKIAIALAVIWMILSIVIYFVSIRKRKSKSAVFLYSILNAVLGGVAISAYYSLKDVAPYRPILMVGVFGALMLANYLLLYISAFKSAFTIINIILSIAIFIAAVYIWIDKDRSLGSSLIFLSMVYLCFSISLHIVIRKDLSRSHLVALSSLLMFGGLFFAVIVMLSEGDALEVLDIDFPVSNRKKRAKL